MSDEVRHLWAADDGEASIRLEYSPNIALTYEDGGYSFVINNNEEVYVPLTDLLELGDTISRIKTADDVSVNEVTGVDPRS